VALRRNCGPLDTTLDDLAIRERYAADDVIIEQSRTDIAASIALRKAAQSERILAVFREQLAATPDKLRAVVSDELSVMSDAIPTLVRDELQTLLAERPDALLALVRNELQILRALERNGAVRSCGGFLGYNIFQRLDDTIAVPRRLGAIDPADPSLRERPGVIAARSVRTVCLGVMWCWIRWAYWDGARG
jgi:hypothetical protein